MINKIKNIARRGISLVLALTMMMPTGVYAGEDQDHWSHYKKELKSGLMEQSSSITIVFGQDAIFTTEETAQRSINDMYENAINEVPRLYGKINIDESHSSISPQIVKTSDNSFRVEEVVFDIEYYNDIDDIKGLLKTEISKIKKQPTAYGKIKRAYDYVLDNLEYDSEYDVHDILSNLNSESGVAVSSDAYAMLFAIMMDELGYENEIVIGTIQTTPIRHLWNLVKVQGNWYHVDARLGKVVYENNDKKYKYFLTSDKVMEENHVHNWDEDHIAKKIEANEVYDSEEALKYEIDFIKGNIEITQSELDKIEKDMTVENIEKTIIGIKAIKDKIIGYKNSIDVLENINEDDIGEFIGKFIGKLNELRDELDGLVNTKSMVDDIVAAIEAVEKVEESKIEEDLTIASDLVGKITQDKYQDISNNLNTRLAAIESIVKGKSKIEEAENILVNANIETDSDADDAVHQSYTRAMEAKDDIETIDEDDPIKSQLQAKIDIIVDVAFARNRIAESEEMDVPTREAYDIAKNAIDNINPSFIRVKGNLENRLAKFEAKLKAIEENAIIEEAEKAIELIDNIVKTLKFEKWELEDKSPINWPYDEDYSLGDWSLNNLVLAAEYAVEEAEEKIGEINDRATRDGKKDQIKEMESLINAIGSVNNAETELLTTNKIKSAKRAIDKVSDIYTSIKTILNRRLTEVENEISKGEIVSKAEKAVEKAEKSLKINDLALAREAVELLKLQGETEFDEKITELKNRNDATEKMMDLESHLTSYLSDFPNGNKINLFDSIEAVNETIEDEILKGDILTQRMARLIVIENAKGAIESIEIVSKKINDGLSEKIEAAIIEAENNISNVTDSKIRRELEKILSNLLSDQERNQNIIKSNEAVEKAELSLKGDDSLEDNRRLVDIANQAVRKLSSGNIKRNHQATIKDLNNAIKAKEEVENAELKRENGSLILRDITRAENAINNVLNQEYIPELKSKVEGLRTALEELEAYEFLNKAIEAIEKAKQSKAARDITSARRAIDSIIDGTFIEIDDIEINKESLTLEIEELEVKIAQDAMRYAEITKVTRDINAAKKAIDAISIKADYDIDRTNLNNRVRAMESYVSTVKVIETAEKTKNLQNLSAAESALTIFENVVSNVAEDNKELYDSLVNEIGLRINAVKTYLEGEAAKVTEAETAVESLEEEMGVDTEPSNTLIQEAQSLVDLVTDRNTRNNLQKRINDIQLAKDAKMAVMRAEAYITDKSVKDAENALNKVNGRFSDIIENLGIRIAILRSQLDISKQVEEATKMVQKAVDSRKSSDSINARFAVESIKDLVDDPEDDNDIYDKLIKILDDLDESIENEEGTEAEALTNAQDALKTAFEIIDRTNTLVVGIIEGEEGEKDKIQDAYEEIEMAKIELIKANAAVRKLSNQKGLLAEIANASEEIDKTEDNIDVKEAVRLVTIASSSVNNASTEEGKSQARLIIAAARRAVDRIGHRDNRAVKTTISNTINSIESKLTTDNDQELIEEAIDEVNAAADILAKAVREDKVMDEQEQIDKTIFAARISIGWISDNNKAAKDTLTSFINDISDMFEAEKEGILNEERIVNAEKAVEAAEAKKGTDDLDSYIRSARLRVRIIKNDGPETAAKIDDLNTRLDVLEGKSPGTGGSDGSGGSSDGGKDSANTDSSGNIVPTTSLPDYGKVIENTNPIWGGSKELRNTNPTQNTTITEMMALKIRESKQNIRQLSNSLKNIANPNPSLIVRGKKIDTDSAAYIHDRMNNSILVPIKYIGNEVGFAVNLGESSPGTNANRLTINAIVNGEVKSISINLITGQYSVNGKTVSVSSKPILQGGRAYIPMDFIVENLGLSFSYSIDDSNIQLIIN